MIRTIEYDVRTNGVTPTAPQFCGVQGEHTATKITFNFDSAVTEFLESAALEGEIKYRIDTENAFGTLSNGEVKELDDFEKAEYTVPKSLTRYGGTARITLVITAIYDALETYETLMTVPVKVYFEEFPTICEEHGEDLNVLYTEITRLRDNTYQLAAEAEEKYNEIDYVTGEAIGRINELSNTAYGFVDTVCSAAESVSEDAEKVTAIADISSAAAFRIEMKTQEIDSFASSAAASKTAAANSASDAESSAEAAAESADEAYASETAVNTAKTSIENTVNGFVSEIGSSIASLVGGKIPMSQIPAVTLTGSVQTGTEDGMASATASDGDIYVCTDTNKTFIYSGGWTRLMTPNEAAVYSEYAETCGIAENSQKLAGFGVEVMTPAEYTAITPLPDTFYFVG